MDKLPREIKLCDDIDNFKKNLKRTYLILLLISYFTILLLVLYIVSFHRCNGA